MGTEREQDYFSDGVTEDIITDLARISGLSVTSRNTASSFKGKEVKLRQLARQLNVTHVLEGSVRRAGDRLRISAQLIDAAQDRPVWADRYDRSLSDIFGAPAAALRDHAGRNRRAISAGGIIALVSPRRSGLASCFRATLA